MKIAVYNNKGGCGKSTITSHLGFYAQEHGIDLTVIDADRQRCTMSWLSGHNKGHGDEGYDIGSVYVTVVDKVYDSEHIIYDCPPNYDVIGTLKNEIDKWIIPIDGRFSIEGAMAVIGEINKIADTGEIYVVVNKGIDNTFGKKERKEIRNLGIKTFYLELLQSDVVRKSETFGIPVWKVPYGSRSGLTQNMLLLCKWVFGGFSNKDLV